MGVQVIGGPETETEPVSLDDLKIEAEAEIEGWGTITPTSFSFKDYLGHYTDESTIYKWDWEKNYYESGNDADYALLYLDILNTTTAEKDYLSDYSVKVVYDDTYEYAGWAYQRNYNYGTLSNTGIADEDKDKQNIHWAINDAYKFAISPMYEGHYIFGCTLPNAVVTGKKPLKLVITIDGNEIIYNIRK